MENIDLKKLAKELGLAISTVSKALSDSYEISPATKKRVLEMAGRLNYTPNPYASSLRQKKSKTIAVVIPEVADNFFAQAINGIESVAHEKGYHVLIYLSHESFQKEEAIIQLCQSGRVDGVLLSVSSETNSSLHIKKLSEKNIPVVLFDRVCEEVQEAKITTNDRQSAYEVTHHLISRGCRRIAFLAVSETLSITRHRLEGYQKALQEQDLPFEKESIIKCTNNPSFNHSLLKSFLSLSTRPDGILSSVDKLAVTVYLVCHELDLHIPTQIKVASFSNLETAPILNPALTTVFQPAFDLGKGAATALFKALENKNFNSEKESKVIPSVLIPRTSTSSSCGSS